MTKIIAFDIETASAGEMHRYEPHDEQGYIRLCGWTDAMDPAADIHISTDPRELLAVLMDADVITGHNILNFDLMAFAKHIEDRYETLARKSFDTMVVERHLVPVAAKGMQPAGFYGLDATAERRGCAGKSTVDFAGKVAIVRRIVGDKKADAMVKARETRIRKLRDKGPGSAASVAKIEAETFGVLKLLADLYGGYDRIPLDDPDYVEYLRRDVAASAALYRALRKLVGVEPKRSVDYLRNEHGTSADMARITIEGCRVDVDLNTTRLAAGQARLEAAKQRMHERYGMPLEGAYPHRTTPGKAAFRAALLGTGIDEELLDQEWPCGADGYLLTGKDVLNGFIPVLEQAGNADAVEICRTILAMNGERTVYQTIDTHLTRDGRVHPYIGPDQASGRWSMKDPGLTVFGKRGGKATERAVILADTDDEVLVAIDADQIDMRIVAAESGDTEYAKLFAPGADAHSTIALLVFDRPECRAEMLRNNGRCDCEWRDRAKICGHSSNYGGGVSTLMRAGVPEDVARKFLDGLRTSFPKRAEWIERTRAAAGAMPYGERAPSHDSYRILRTWAGRPVRVERERAYTQATALIGQGGTRDAMACAIRNMPVHIRRKVRAVIHDEIVISLPRDGAEELAQSIADSMAFEIKGVPITFGVSELSVNWAGCYGY